MEAHRRPRVWNPQAPNRTLASPPSACSDLHPFCLELSSEYRAFPSSVSHSRRLVNPRDSFGPPNLYLTDTVWVALGTPDLQGAGNPIFWLCWVLSRSFLRLRPVLSAQASQGGGVPRCRAQALGALASGAAALNL